MRLGTSCNPTFKLTQHQRDVMLLNRIQSLLGCGKFYGPYSESNCLDLWVSDLSMIVDKIIPFFTEYPLHGAKALDFRDFSKGVSIMNQGRH